MECTFRQFISSIHRIREEKVGWNSMQMLCQSKIPQLQDFHFDVSNAMQRSPLGGYVKTDMMPAIWSTENNFQTDALVFSNSETLLLHNLTSIGAYLKIRVLLISLSNNFQPTHCSICNIKQDALYFMTNFEQKKETKYFIFIITWNVEPELDRFETV